jgi:hypothetical protein
MLNSHPEVAMPRETRFVLEAWGRRREFGDLQRAENRQKLARWIFMRDGSLAPRLGLDREQAVDRLVEAAPTLGSVLGTCFVLYARKHRKRRWGDKRPRYAARMKAVWDLFPNAQFINVIRDPRACVASMRRIGWWDGDLVNAVELWEHSVRTVEEWRPRLARDQLLDVEYESLVSDPRATLGAIAEFAGLNAGDEAIERMLGYHRRKEVRSARFAANLSRPPDPERVSAWKQALTGEEVALVEDAAGSWMSRYGYEPVAGGGTPPGQLLRDLRARRRWRAVTKWKIAANDRLQTVLTRGRPLKAELPAVASIQPAHADRQHRAPAAPSRAQAAEAREAPDASS